MMSSLGRSPVKGDINVPGYAHRDNVRTLPKPQ